MATVTDRPRMRVSRACNECRKRKDRCDGCRPTCNNCARQARPCSYRPSKKRGLRTGYVRAIEALLGLVFSSVHDVEQWLCALLDGHDPPSPGFRLRAPTSDSVESLLDAWRQSSVVARIEQLLSAADTADQETGDTSSLFDRRALHALALVRRACGTHDNHDTHDALTDDVPVYPPPSPMDTDLASVDATREPIDNLLQPLTPVPSHPETHGHLTLDPPAPTPMTLPSNWQQLLDSYFATTHCWLPVSPKHHLLRTAYVLAGGPADSTVPSQGDIAFLMAALTCASSQPQILPPATQSQPASQNARQDCLLATTMSLLSGEPDACELGHVRALLLLTLAYLRNCKQKAAWSAVGRAIYAAISLDTTPFRLTKQAPARDDLKRTMLCCILLDSLVACWIQARPHFQRSDINLVGLLLTEGMEEWEPWQPPITPLPQLSLQLQPARILSNFNHLMELVGLLNDCLRLPTAGDESHLKTLVEEFQSLVSRLPPLSDSQSIMPLQILHLHLLANTIASMLHSKLLSFPGMEIGPDLIGYAQLWKLCNVLEHYRLTTGPPTFLPTLRVCTDILCSSLEYQEQLAAQSQDTRHDLRVLQQRFAQLTPAHGDDVAPLEPTSENLRLDVTIQASNSFTTLPNQNVSHISNDVPLNVSVAPNNPILSTIQPEVSEALANSGGNSFPWASIPQATQAGYTAPSQMISQNQAQVIQKASFDSLMGFIPGDMTEDSLFQSLTDLDAADWSANSPNFMKHLGAPSDLFTDLNVIFNTNPV